MPRNRRASGTVTPAILVLAVVLSEQGRGGWRLSLQAIPFALSVGITQAATSWAVVALLGPEFPSLLGSLAGFLAGLAMLRTGWLVPRETWRVASAEHGEPAATAEITVPQQVEPTKVAAFAPYVLLLALLVLSRTRALPFGDWLASGLAEAIDQRLHLFKVHLPYHESDHVLNLAYNALCGGTCLKDLELRRQDEAYLNLLRDAHVPPQRRTARSLRTSQLH